MLSRLWPFLTVLTVVAPKVPKAFSTPFTAVPICCPCAARFVIFCIKSNISLLIVGSCENRVIKSDTAFSSLGILLIASVTPLYPSFLTAVASKSILAAAGDAAVIFDNAPANPLSVVVTMSSLSVLIFLSEFIVLTVLS